MSKLRTYIENTVDELVNKVSWPTWEELQTSSIIVLVASIMIALAVWVMDFVFGVRTGEVFWKGILGTIYSWF